jgi:hypothetical protein
VLANLFKIILNVQTASPVEAYAYIIFVVLFLLPSSIVGLIQFMIVMPYAKSLAPSEFWGLAKNPLFYAFSILGWVLNLIYWYGLSCLIVWIYDKFRKKKGDYIPIHNINMIMGNQKRDKKKK